MRSVVIKDITRRNPENRETIALAERERERKRNRVRAQAGSAGFLVQLFLPRDSSLLERRNEVNWKRTNERMNERMNESAVVNENRRSRGRLIIVLD